MRINPVDNAIFAFFPYIFIYKPMDKPLIFMDKSIFSYIRPF